MGADNKNLPVSQSTNIDSSKLDTDIAEITQKIITENSVSETQDLVQLFNWNLSKKNALRILKLTELEGLVTDQMITRFEKRSGEFSNDDLLKYLQTVENSIEKAQKNLNPTEMPTPTIDVKNNTQVNINVLDSFDSDSKARIEDAIKAFLVGAQHNNDEPVETVEFTDMTKSTADEQKGEN